MARTAPAATAAPSLRAKATGAPTAGTALQATLRATHRHVGRGAPASGGLAPAGGLLLNPTPACPWPCARPRLVQRDGRSAMHMGAYTAGACSPRWREYRSRWAAADRVGISAQSRSSTLSPVCLRHGAGAVVVSVIGGRLAGAGAGAGGAARVGSFTGALPRRARRARRRSWARSASAVTQPGTPPSRGARPGLALPQSPLADRPGGALPQGLDEAARILPFHSMRRWRGSSALSQGRPTGGPWRRGSRPDRARGGSFGPRDAVRRGAARADRSGRAGGGAVASACSRHRTGSVRHRRRASDSLQPRRLAELRAEAGPFRNVAALRITCL